MKIACGVLQGSVLGPSLNDTFKKIFKGSNLILLADNTIIFSGNSYEELINNVNNELRQLKIGWIVIHYR